MDVKLIQIGSSKGIRIPAKVLNSLGNPDEFKLNITDYGIFLKPKKNDIRSGWQEAYFKSNACIIDKKRLE